MDSMNNSMLELNNNSSESNDYSTEVDIHLTFESKMAILVGITFSATIVIGLVGNSLVLLTYLFQKQMRSTTNIIILNLAIAELLFIFLCVPFTGFNYVLSKWYFGDIICKIYQYTANVTAYVLILLLVLMSLDRYLAICSIGNTTIRNKRNVNIAIIILWIVVLVLNLPHLFMWEEYSYSISNENRTVCILKYNIIISKSLDPANESELVELETAKYKIQAYYSIFFMAAYVLPCVSICIIYGLLMKKLKEIKGKQVSKSKRKVTLMVVVVVSSFVLCWGPLQIMLFLQHVVKVDFEEIHITILIITNCIAYLNTCVNPIIYGFANQDFRRAYAAILRCDYDSRNPFNTNYTVVGTQVNKHDIKTEMKNLRSKSNQVHL
ncbi:unnamed protein product [Brachionus calyciflorus]|uniref:G-protein coupled receptors family 1 profile domain-containing protein n=1 Tax=Brachionus calyciflorus TaxID=104777 RepID=A0A813M6B9_9BILA|nr:unnamed protein product [Brachionus calyciflorus]